MPGFGQVAGMAGDVWGAITQGQNVANARNDRNKIDTAYGKFNELYDIDPQMLKIKAQQMGIQPDVLASRIRNDQLNALRQMQNIASLGGMDNAAIAANQQAGMDAARMLKGNTQAIQGQLARQGMNPGSGAGIAQGQMAAQAASNSLQAAGSQNAANAQMRALQAINSSGRIAGDIASSQQQRAQANRRARMQRDRFNTQIRNQANRFNSGAILNANNYNLNRRTGQMNAAIGSSDASGRADTRASASQQKASEYFQDFGDNLDSSFGGGGGFGFGG